MKLSFTRFIPVFLLLFVLNISFAQPVISPYPVPASVLTRGLDTGLLTVKIKFSGACAGNDIQIRLSEGMTYIPGSFTVIAGLSLVAESGTARVPVFRIADAVSASDSIVFTIARKAGCGVSSTAKDSVFVSGSCGADSETGITVNNYVVYSPSLSITPAPTINGANIGQGYSRVFTVTNGGNGCLDTLRLAAVRHSSISGGMFLIGTTVIPPYATNGDTSFYTIAASLLSADNLLCNGESVQITDSFILSGCASLATTFLASWGTSFNDNCDLVGATSIITMNSGVPTLSATRTAPAISACGTIPRKITYTITNNGTAPASNIFMKFGNTYAGAFFPYAYFIDTASILLTLHDGTPSFHPVSGIAATNIIGGGNNAPQCAYPKIGMTSITLPANYVLPAGQSLSFSVDIQTCEMTACNSGGGYDAGTMSVQVTYKDQCATNNYNLPLGTAGLTPGIRVGGGFSTQVPAQVFSGNCFDYKVNYSTYFTSGAGYSNAYVEYKITLPPGVSLDTVTEGVRGDVPLAGYPVLSGSDLIVRYALDHSGGFYQLLNFKLCIDASTCGNQLIAAQSRTTMDGTCTNPIVSFSCVNNTFEAVCAAPCPSGGATPVNWIHNRITYGAADNDNNGRPDISGSVDTTRIDRSHYRPGDVMATMVASLITQNALVPYTTWPYVFSEWDFGYGNWRLHDSVSVVIRRGGTDLYTITGIVPVVLTAATGSAGPKLRADWSSRLPSGFAYEEGDSVIVFADFKLVGSISSNTNTTSSPYGGRTVAASSLKQYVYAANTTPPPAGGLTGPSRFSCFLPIYNYYILGTEHFLSFNGVNANGPSGCTNFDVTANAYTITRDYQNQRFFPYEYRPAVVPDTFTFAIPAGWEFVQHNSAKMFYNTAPTTSSNLTIAVIPTLSGNALTGTTVKYDFRSLLASAALPFISTEGAIFELSLKIRPTCSAPVAAPAYFSENGHYDYYPSADTPAYYALTTGATLNYSLINSRPDISLQDNSGTVQGVLPQQYWDIQVNNPSQQTAPYIWLSIEKGTSGITVDSVVLKPSNTVLIPNAYGSGNTWYQLSPGGVVKGGNQMARIYFKYTSCVLDSVKLSGGWNCSGFPSPDPLSYSCNKDSLYLKVEPLPSRIQLSMDRQPGAPTIALCEADSVTIRVNSALAANIVEPVITIPVPAGMSIILPVQVEYPLNSGMWQNVTPVISGGAYALHLSGHSGIGVNGLPGTAITADASRRQAKVRVAYTTSCDFVSGSLLSFVATAKRPCTGLGALGSGNTTYSNPVKITGADVTGTATVSISLASANMVCGDTTALSSLVVPNTDPTTAGDTVVYTVPAGLNYAGNFTNLSGCAGCGVKTVTGPLGSTVIKVGLTAGITAGTPINYTFDLSTTAAVAGCDTLEITGQAERMITGLNCGPDVCSNNKVAIGTATPARVKLDKPLVNIVSITAEHDSIWARGLTQNAIVRYLNTGSQPMQANAYTVEFFCGSASMPFEAKLITKTVPAGASVIDTYSVFIPASCSLGDLVTAKLQLISGSGIQQCLCAPSSFQLLGVPLPLQFLSAGAKSSDCVVTVDWQYNNTRRNISGFMMERSADGRNFEVLGTLNPEVQQYIDLTPFSGNWFYRIGAKELDGKVSYTSVMKVQTLQCTHAAVSVYPNPASSELNIVLQGASSAVYKITDLTGRVVQEGRLSLPVNRLNTSGMARGVYQLDIEMNGSVQKQSISIIK